MLIVWGRATSSNVQKVMWTVGELGLPHRRIDVGGAFGGLDTPEFRALTPHGLIPVVQTSDGFTLWESNAIVRHLAISDPERRLWPAETQPVADMWAEWAHNTVMRPIIALFWALVRTPPSKRDPAAIEAHRTAAVRALTTADDALSARSFLAGDTLTIADINLGHVLYRWHEMEIERPEMPGLSAYYRRLGERPAYAAHVMVDFSSLRATD